ncbi:MAG: 50S ribosomal protein L6 [Candidatus Pacebacteria bacterium]|jgi:large subunit ribosomal protein L6|nr:50S ribosomal protein L6 [bacterium]MDP6527297.1 50S ribosomal protein L6 [Candidatus Paceibacterota bacterium]MDP6659425.1 50S ribosomal protein L6 [Candidatus Paceibacterota bacterium]|tara:strand:- start:13799 stop:14332 length:534 start_codon:yes stop_codon:yes gene_type:complete
MSRIGKQTITIPEKTEVSANDGMIIVKGPLGELKKPFSGVNIDIKDGEVSVSPANDSKLSQALWGTFASHIKNMVNGVNTPYEKKLVVEGVGYKAEVSGKDLVLNVGFSHPVKLEAPEGLNVSAEKNVITISGSDKEKVGQFASNIRLVKKPEPYKGKGIRYEDEVVRRKQGKKAVA